MVIPYDEHRRAELHDVAGTDRDGLADQPAVHPGAVVGAQVAKQPAVLAPVKLGMTPGNRQVGNAQVAILRPADAEARPAARREHHRRRLARVSRPAGPVVHGGPGRRLRWPPRGVRRAGRYPHGGRPRRRRVPARDRTVRVWVRVPAAECGPDPVPEPGPPGRQVAEEPDQLTAVPRAERALHAKHERVVGQPALDELLAERADRQIALLVGGAQILGRCRRVRRRPSHEWSIDIIRAVGKGKPRISAPRRGRHRSGIRLVPRLTRWSWRACSRPCRPGSAAGNGRRPRDPGRTSGAGALRRHRSPARTGTGSGTGTPTAGSPGWAARRGWPLPSWPAPWTAWAPGWWRSGRPCTGARRARRCPARSRARPACPGT